MTDDCIISPAYKDKDGYPRLKVGKRIWRCSRLLWKILYGDPGEGNLVLHKCDNPSCVNPDHLYLGSFEDNMKDKVDRLRVAGENHPKSKLSEEQVDLIKKMYNDADYSQEYIGSLFGVRQTTISKIIRGERKSSRNKETNDNAQVLVF